MEYSKDFIEREIQKLTLLLIKLVNGLSENNTINSENEIKETEESLKKIFGLTVTEIIEMDDVFIVEKLKYVHPIHFEKLVELIYVIVKKNKFIDNEKDKKELINKGLSFIDLVNSKSEVFSLDRINLRNSLEKLLK